MATASGDWSKENETFVRFVRLSNTGKKLTDADLKLMNSTGCKKMVKDCKFPAEIISSIADVEFAKCKTKGKTTMPIDKFPAFIEGCAHSLAMRTKPKCPKDDEKVISYVESFRAKICSGTADIKKTKMSTTGNVDSLTDASKYTGSHKERFDAEGKGKGTSGRVEDVNASGYVGNYKGAGTFEEKK